MTAQWPDPFCIGVFCHHGDNGRTQLARAQRSALTDQTKKAQHNAGLSRCSSAPVGQGYQPPKHRSLERVFPTCAGNLPGRTGTHSLPFPASLSCSPPMEDRKSLIAPGLSWCAPELPARRMQDAAIGDNSFVEAADAGVNRKRRQRSDYICDFDKSAASYQTAIGTQRSVILEAQPPPER